MSKPHEECRQALFVGILDKEEKMMAKKKKVSQNYMDAVYEVKEGLVWRKKENGLVELDMVHKGVYNKIAQKFFHRPKVSHIALDDYGTALWEALDGTNTVFELVHIMQERFPGEQDRMLQRVISFMGTLERTGFIQRKNRKEG
jgi:hypothetical protein